MRLPRPTLPTTWAALRRPAVLAPVTTMALAGLLGAGLLVAHATDPGPTTAVDATASPAAGGSTTSGGDDNVAVAVNTKDGSTVYAVRLKVVFTDADQVDAGNAAVAAASCTDCTTVAIALEGVIISGDAEVIAPENIALAINSGCTNCQTLAYAYQNVQTVDGRVRMTGAGRKRVAELRRQLHDLRTSGLDVLAVRAEVNRIAGEFAEVLRTEVVPVGERKGPASPAPDASTPPASTDPQPSAPAEGAGTTGQPEATQAPQPQPSSEPTGEPSPSA